MPVADWNERSRINFQARPPRTSGITKLTRMRSQPMAFVLSGATTGIPAGLVCEFVGGVAVGAVVVGVAVTVGVAVLAALAYVVLGPAVKAKITCASTPSKTSVVANCSGFSERAGVTRYQCPSHMAVMTPPSASAAAKKLAMVNAPPRFAAARGR